jgi:hypothetical protein
MSQNSAIFFELASFFCLFVVKILATVAKTFTIIEKTERKAFDKERSALEVQGFSKLVFLSCIWEMSQNSAIFFELSSFFLPFCGQNLGNSRKNIHENRKDRAQGF